MKNKKVEDKNLFERNWNELNGVQPIYLFFNSYLDEEDISYLVIKISNEKEEKNQEKILEFEFQEDEEISTDVKNLLDEKLDEFLQSYTSDHLGLTRLSRNFEIIFEKFYSTHMEES